MFAYPRALSRSSYRPRPVLFDLLFQIIHVHAENGCDLPEPLFRPSLCQHKLVNELSRNVQPSGYLGKI